MVEAGINPDLMPQMTTLMIMVLTLAVGLLSTLFYFLDKRQQDLTRKFNIIAKNIDLLHENQKHILANQIKFRHGQKEVSK